MTPFEQRLKETPRREVPADWRQEILGAVARQRTHSPWTSLVLPAALPWEKLRGWLWPHPYAWGALAVCWLIIAALNVSGPRGEALYAVVPSGTKKIDLSTERYVEYLQWRERLLVQNKEKSDPPFDRNNL